MIPQERILVCSETALQLKKWIKEDLKEHGRVPRDMVGFYRAFAKDDASFHRANNFSHCFGGALAQGAGQKKV